MPETTTGLPVTRAHTSSLAPSWSCRNRCGDRGRAGHHLDQIVHGGLCDPRAVLLGEQRGRQFRLLQLVPLLGEQRADRDTRRRRDPTARPGRRLGRETVPLQPAQRALGVVLAEREPPGEIGHVGGAHGHQCPVGRLVCLVQPYRCQTCRSQHAATPLPEDAGRGGKRPRRKTASAHHRRTPVSLPRWRHRSMTRGPWRGPATDPGGPSTRWVGGAADGPRPPGTAAPQGSGSHSGPNRVTPRRTGELGRSDRDPGVRRAPGPAGHTGAAGRFSRGGWDRPAVSYRRSMSNPVAGFSGCTVFIRPPRWTIRGMSQQGEKPTGQEDDWWGQLYDDSTGDTGPAAAADSLDDRFASASDTLGAPDDAPPPTPVTGPGIPPPRTRTPAERRLGSGSEPAAPENDAPAGRGPTADDLVADGPAVTGFGTGWPVAGWGPGERQPPEPTGGPPPGGPAPGSSAAAGRAVGGPAAGEPVPGGPTANGPAPGGLEPGGAASGGPHAAVPHAAGPCPMGLQSVALRRTARRMAGPRTADPRPVGPQAANPCLIRPQPAGPRPMGRLPPGPPPQTWLTGRGQVPRVGPHPVVNRRSAERCSGPGSRRTTRCGAAGSSGSGRPGRPRPPNLRARPPSRRPPSRGALSHRPSHRPPSHRPPATEPPAAGPPAAELTAAEPPATGHSAAEPSTAGPSAAGIPAAESRAAGSPAARPPAAGVSRGGAPQWYVHGGARGRDARVTNPLRLRLPARHPRRRLLRPGPRPGPRTSPRAGRQSPRPRRLRGLGTAHL